MSFDAYDTDGNGRISLNELESMFKSAWISGFKAMHSVVTDSNITPDEIDRFSSDCARSFAASVMEEMDTNGDGELDFEEFRIFALKQPVITATLEDFQQPVCILYSGLLVMAPTDGMGGR